MPDEVKSYVPRADIREAVQITKDNIAYLAAKYRYPVEDGMLRVIWRNGQTRLAPVGYIILGDPTQSVEVWEPENFARIFAEVKP